MREKKLFRSVLAIPMLTLALGAVAAGESACVTIPPEGKQPVLSTHVKDWRDEVIYQVLVDRFANGDVNNDFLVRPGPLARYQGGDWQGIIDHLDYFQELGVTTLWISPIVKNVETDADVDAYHGYWAQDLTELNPHFGDLSDLRRMTAAVHERGMKVVLDIVTNHMGQVFFYDINQNGQPDVYIGGSGSTSPVTRSTEFDPDFDPRGVQSFTSLGEAGRAPMVFIQDPKIHRVPPRPSVLGTAAAYHGKGRTLNYDDPDQLLTGDFPGGLKDVATENPEVRAAMIDAYTRWVELADLDGFRIDTVKHVEHEFWTTFAPAVRQRLAAQNKKNFLMFGEAFDGNDKLLGSFTRPGELDSVFYFSQHYVVFRDIFMYAHDEKLQKGTSQIAALWAKRLGDPADPKAEVVYSDKPQEGGIGLPPNKALVNFIDNHDVARFLFSALGDVPALRNALTYLFLEDGIPCLYYGTELDFAGGNDPANREVVWPTGFPTTGDTFRHIAKLARLRREYAALRYGDAKIVYSTDHTAKEEDAGMFAFERVGGSDGPNQYALVVLNTNGRKPSVTNDAAGGAMKLSAKPGSVLVDVLDPALAKYPVGADGTLRVKVDAQRAVVLVPEADVVR